MKRKQRKQLMNKSSLKRLSKKVGVALLVVFSIVASGCSSTPKSQSSPSAGDAWLTYSFNMRTNQLMCFFIKAKEDPVPVPCYEKGWMLSDEEMRRMQ